MYEVFSHEPEVVKAPGDKYVMYYTASLRSKHGLCNCCRANASKCDGSTGPGDCPSEQEQWSKKRKAERRLDADPSFMSYASNPDGPWTVGGKLFPDYQ